MTSEKQDSKAAINEAEEEHLIRKKKIIYDVGADAMLEFQNDEPIQINKTVLALQSKYFFHVFFESPALDAKVEIKDFDRETFKTFLDCLFGLKEYSVLDALLIYPIAHKYDAKKCLQKCSTMLKPKEMNENVCLSLNLALLFDNQELVQAIISFIKYHFGVVNVIENKTYRELLEPNAMFKLLEYVDLDSYVWKIIYEWGKDYLKSGRDVRSFLTENDFLRNLSLSDFESVQSILDFHKITNRELLNSEEVFDYLENNLTKKPEEKLPEKSCWMNVKKGDEITETIVFKKPFVYSCEDSKKINIFINRVRPNLPNINYSHIVNCKVRYNFRDRPSEKKETPSQLPLKSQPLFPSPSMKTSDKFSFGAVPLGNSEPILSGNLFSSPKIPAVFSFGSVHEVKEKFDSFSFKKFSFPVHFPHEFSEIISVEITYSFKFDCKILKTSVSANFVDSDKLHFTKDVVLGQTAFYDQFYDLTCDEPQADPRHKLTSKVTYVRFKSGRLRYHF